MLNLIFGRFFCCTSPPVDTANADLTTDNISKTPEEAKIPKNPLNNPKRSPGSISSKKIIKKRFQAKERHLIDPRKTISLKDVLEARKYQHSMKNLYIDDAELSKVIKYILANTKSLVSLRALKIYLTSSDFTKDHAMKRFSQLRKITLSFSLNGEKEMEGVGNALKRLVFLEEIDLGFYRCLYTSDSGYRKLSQGLKQCRLLRKLSQGLKQCRLLRKLSLLFYWCESITQKGFDSINQAVSRLVGLESLSLWFLAGFRNHAKIGLKGLSQSLGSLVNLTDLKIQLSEFINFKDEDFSYLKEGLKTLRGVKRISIGFSECEMITDFALSELSEGIIALQGLSSLKLGFFM